jgi:N-acetylneuraminic acid mutarotase
LNNKIYIISGFENGHNTTTVEVYDPAANKWSSASPLPQPLNHTAAAASYNGKLCVVGGGGYRDRNILSNKTVHLFLLLIDELKKPICKKLEVLQLQIS